MIDTLKALRERSPVLSAVSDEDVSALAELGDEVERGEGEILFEPGEAGTAVFLILEGTVSVASSGDGPETGRRELGPGEVVGAVTATTGGAVQHEVRCLSPCRFVRVRRDRLADLLETAPGVWTAFHELALRRVRQRHLAVHLDSLFGPFGRLLPFVMRDLEDDLEWVTLESGRTLFEQGDPATDAFVVVTGRLVVVGRGPESEEKILRTIVPGESVGEVDLLTERPRSSTVFAGRDSELVRLPRRSFELMLERSSNAVLKVSRLLADRLAVSALGSSSQDRAIGCIGLVPAHPEIPLDAMVRELVVELGGAARTSVAVLTSDSVDRALDAPGISQASQSDPAQLRLTQWLQEQESAHEWLLYVADQEWTGWTERCVRQSDRLAVVSDADGSTDLTSVARRLAGPRRRWSLVLVHPRDRARPQGTGAWLASVPDVDAVYHVRRSNKADAERIARILSGRAVGLVLGGGGARGCAHFGVLRALEELGIPVDMIGGTSIGAAVSGWVAQDLSAADALSRARASLMDIRDYSLPVASLIAGKRLTEVIEREVDPWDIEDFWIPFFCMSTNLTTASPVVHDRGSSMRAIRASVSIPGVMPPVPSEGDILVDGGVLNNLPIDVMRSKNPFGRVIAVDVVAPSGPKAKEDYGLSVSGWKLAAERALPGRRPTRVPGIAATILRSMVVGAGMARSKMLEEGLADLYLNIHVRGVGLLEFERIDEVERMGYDQTIEPLRAWLASGEGG